MNNNLVDALQNIRQRLESGESIPRGQIPHAISDCAYIDADLKRMLHTPPETICTHGEQCDKPEQDEWLTKEEAAQLLNVHPNWLAGKKFPFVKRIGHRTVRYSKQGLLRWMATRRMA